MSFSQRPLESRDLSLISSFAQSDEELFFLFPKPAFPLSSKQLTENALKREASIVALLDAQVVGYVDMANVRPDLFCTLGHLVVSAPHRRQGVATYLVNTMIQIAKEKHNARFMRAACFSHNSAGYQLYHGMGFKPADMVHRTAPDGETVLLVNMELACRK